MGLGSRSGGSNKNYLGIYGGQIAREWRKKKPSEAEIPAGKELQEREISKGPNAGNTVWFVGFDYLEGKVNDLKLDTEGKYGDKIVIEIDDVGDIFQLEFGANSSYGSDFLMKLPNIDFDADIILQPWTMTPEEWFELTDKKVTGNRSGLTIYNGTYDKENKVYNYYTKDNPNGLPEIIIKKGRNGKNKVDSDDRDNFLLDQFEAFIAENFNDEGTPKASTKPEPQPVAADGGGAKKGKLPF